MSAMEAESAPPRPVNRLLWIAAAAGAEAAVKLHIARGDYLEWRDKRGLTPLMIAASRDRAAVCRLLLDAGVDAGALDAAGRDALSIAREAGALAAAEVIAACIPAKPSEIPPAVQAITSFDTVHAQNDQPLTGVEAGLPDETSTSTPDSPVEDSAEPAVLAVKDIAGSAPALAAIQPEEGVGAPKNSANVGALIDPVHACWRWRNSALFRWRRCGFPQIWVYGKASRPSA